MDENNNAIEKELDTAVENEAVTDTEVINDDIKEDKEEKESRHKRNLASAFDIMEMLAVCATVILLLFTFCFRLTVVDGPSMNQTLTHGDYLIVQSIGYKPDRGDIIVIHDPTAAPYDKPLIKRLIAVGGDTVDIDFATWTVTVNGEVIDESEYLYIDPNQRFTSNYSFPITVDEGKIFVMGDNRHHSADSRVTAIGQIDERCIVGKAILRLLPMNNFKIFD